MDNSATIFFKNCRSTSNEKLVDFLKNLIPQTANIGIKFNFQLVNPSDYKKFRELQITKFPTLIYDNKKYIGPKNIENYCLSLIQTKKKQKLAFKEDDVSEYFNKEINSLQRDSQGNIIDDEDERDQAESKRQQRLQSEVKRRKKSTLPKNSPGNKNIPKLNFIILITFLNSYKYFIKEIKFL